MPIMPYIAIPGRSFLRDIIDWYHRTSFITNRNRLTTIDLMIKSHKIVDHKDQVFNTNSHNEKINVVEPSSSRPSHSG